MPKRQSGNKKGRQSNFAKLSIFQPNKYKFKKSCPLSVKGAPKIDYKNIRLLKKYISENGKILPSRITNVSQKNDQNSSKIAIATLTMMTTREEATVTTATPPKHKRVQTVRNHPKAIPKVSKSALKTH